MKKTYLFTILLSFSFAFAQSGDETQKSMVASEMKSASKLINFQANPNTANYDITHHKLEFTVNPAVYAISGKVTTTFKALDNMTAVTFDLTNQLMVSSVKKDNINLSFVQNSNNELVITLPGTQTTGTSATVEIIYSGAPASGEQAFVTSTHSGTPVLWTLSEPFGARDWWPCKQDLNDKIENLDIFITAPSQYTSVSNGVEQSQLINGSNKTTHFKHNYPIPAYLIAIAVTNYTTYTQQGGTFPNTFPIVNYMYPESLSSNMTNLAQTPVIMDLFESKFETYPFFTEKYGHAQFGWGGGMEHTTVSFMGSFNRSLIAHELAHQWFGDKITCGTWKDIWLNEGFAEYLSGMVVENLDGDTAFTSWKNSKINTITSQSSGNLYLTDTQATNVNRIFDSRLTYDKGAMVVHMLRFKMGDAMFFQAIKNYLADPTIAYKYAITTQLKTHLESVYGQSLSEFFDDWIYKQGHPTYTVTAQNWGAGQARITVNQTQSHTSVSFFEMPLPIRLTGSGGQTHDVIVNNNFNGETFIVPVPFTVTGVQFDPKKNIISKNSTATLGNETFKMEKAIVLYPNPASDLFHIQMPNSVTLQNVIIYNNLGQKISEHKTSDIMVSTLTKGVHFVQIVTSEGTFHKKLTKN